MPKRKQVLNPNNTQAMPMDSHRPPFDGIPHPPHAPRAAYAKNCRIGTVAQILGSGELVRNSDELTAARPASFNVTNLVILKPARIHSSSGIWFHILQACTQMYQIGMTSAGRSALVGRETRGTAGRRGRETRPPRRWVTNRYPIRV